MQDQQNASVPDLNRMLKEEDGPSRRNGHIKYLRNLDHLPAIVSIGEGAKVNRQQQKRCPVADFGKSCEGRRVEFLEQQPITDNVLDVVRHHRQHRSNKEESEVSVVKRGECELFSRASLHFY